VRDIIGIAHQLPDDFFFVHYDSQFFLHPAIDSRDLPPVPPEHGMLIDLDDFGGGLGVSGNFGNM
jgi:hypothetical protein